MPLNKEKNIWLIAASAGAVVAAALLLWIIPQTRALTSQVTALQKQRAEIDLLQKKSASGGQQKSFDLYFADAERLKLAAVTEDSMIALIETLERIASETGVSPQFSVQGTAGKKNAPAATATPDQKNPAQATAAASDVKLQLVLSGAWPNVLAMVDKTENLPAVINITDLTIHGAAATASAPTDAKLPVSTNLPTATLSLTIPLDK